jgi:DNA-binding HxlR family transcriptional regulator
MTTAALPELFHRYRGSAVMVALLADKWTIPVLHQLALGALRTGQLRDALGTVSQKMLTQTLRALEDYGMVERRVFATVPPRVEYSLTAVGYSVNEPLAALCKWIEKNGDLLDAAQQRRRRRTAKRQTGT